MSLRTALRYIIGIFVVSLLSAGAWEWNAYSRARRQVGQVLADNTLLGREARELALALLGTLLVVACGGLLALFGFDRWVRRPINDLRNQLTMVASGNRDHVIKISRPEEIADLARDANDMRISLNGAVEQATRAFESLEAQDPVTALLSEELKAADFHILPAHLDVDEHISSAHGVISGDWWSGFRTGGRNDDLGGDPGTAIAIVDVAGHDPRAGILGLKLKATLATALAAGFQPGTIFNRISQLMTDLNATHATAFVVIFPDDESLPISWVNAGHPSPLLLSAQGIVRSLQPTGPMLAGLGGFWGQDSCNFSQGDRLLLFTDGLEETRNDKGEEFGIERIVKVFQESQRQLSSREVVDRVVTSARTWSTSWRNDDVTVVSVSRRVE